VSKISKEISKEIHKEIRKILILNFHEVGKYLEKMTKSCEKLDRIFQEFDYL